ncbi:unnamed protein product [Haemonchus placei]|uniref:Ovule protein n=1 Tax=Haemonchus placei TaxID=6290 RepID=A0A0N4W3C9_HAEPC|nr:unnamed protein product [Haemonchus placei]
MKMDSNPSTTKIVIEDKTQRSMSEKEVRSRSRSKSKSKSKSKSQRKKKRRDQVDIMKTDMTMPDEKG